MGKTGKHSISVHVGHKSEVERSPCQRLLLAQRGHFLALREWSASDAKGDTPQPGPDRLSSANSGYSATSPNSRRLFRQAVLLAIE